MTDQNNLEIKLLMKNIKKNNNIIEKRNKTRQEIRNRRKEREKRFEEVAKRNELNEKNKKNQLYKRRMTRDLKDIQKRYQILKPEYDENDLYYNNKNIKNKKIGNKINIYSNNRRQHLNFIKDNFYKKNENLKIDQNDNFLENLNKVDNEIKFFEKPKNMNDNNANKINDNKKNNNIQTFNKTKNNMNKNKNKNLVNNNNHLIGNKNSNKSNNNNLEIIGKKYDFKVIDNKLNAKVVNNICFDGDFFQKFPDINQNKKEIKKQNKCKNNKKI